MKSIIVFAGLVCVTSACGPMQGAPDLALNDASDASENKQALSTADSAFLTRQGNQFYLQITPVAFVGVNRYELAGSPLAASCTHGSDAAAWAVYEDNFIQQAAAMGAKFIRLWAFQNFAGPHGNDFSGLDQVVASAKKYNVRLILTLENNWADCTQPAGVPKDGNWFGGGYRGNYGYPLNFVDYTRAIVTHFKDEPTIAMWQILNEGKWYQAPGILRQFFLDVSSLIRSIDAHHLISSGGAIQCWQGAQGATDFQSFYDGPNIDVLDAHDYSSETQAWPDCIQAAWLAAQALGKPFMIGESGISTDAFDPNERAQNFAKKMQTAAGKNTAAYLIWSLNTQASYHDGFDFFPGDATAAVVQTAASQWYHSTPVPASPAPTPTPIATPSPSPTPTAAPGATFGCSIAVARGNTWQTGTGTWAGILNMTVSNTGNKTLPVPWNVQVNIAGMVSLQQPWTWQITNQKNNQATGTVSGSWAALQANGANAVALGGIASLSRNGLQVGSVQVNGVGCTVVQAQ